MIRPRVGDFVFSAEEMETMMEDISAFHTLGVYGIVIGALLPDGSVDCEACARLTAAALPMQVTFHRAFDLTADPHRALKDIAGIPGITRILTSGHATPRVYEPTSLERLAELVASALSTSQQSKGPHHIADATLRIVPGSGINPQTIGLVFSVVGELVDEYHMSGGSWIDRPAHATKGEEFQMGPRGYERAVWRTDANQVRGVLRMLAQMRGDVNA
ncbi:Copper homeostasis protein CutC [Rhizoctonia solani AG-1 IB]|nr:Copper homeostasis protein CutC [Rhizoctonia solani AG-1 IB]